MIRLAVSAFEGWQIVEFKEKLELLALEPFIYYHRGPRGPFNDWRKEIPKHVSS